ncbi:MAG: M24 family metallopeptidase [Armatimonadota bacterium]
MTPSINVDFHNERLVKLQALLAEREIDLAVLQYATDLYYYSGSVQPLYLLVPRDGEARVLARKSLTRIAEEAPGLSLHAFDGTKEFVAILEQAGALRARRIGFTLDTASYASIQRFQKLCPQAETADLSWDVRLLRMTKSPEEIAVLARAGAIMDRLPDLLRTHFTPGMTELALSAALEYEFRLRGHDGLIRCRREGVEMSACGVCVSGARALAGSKFEGVCGGVGLSPAVPYGATAHPISRGEPILLDFGFVSGGYHLDQTRMACWGEPSEIVQRAYAAMLAVEATVFDALRPGVTWEAVYSRALEHAGNLGYADTFMGVGREQVSFIGHGVGLELDEPPFLAPRMPYPLEAGMTLAIEPKVALPEIGVIGIEDTVVVRDGAPERLTTCSQEFIRL